MAAEGGLLSGLWYIFRGKTPAEEGDGQPGDFEDGAGKGGGGKQGAGQQDIGPMEEDVLVEPYFGTPYVYNSTTGQEYHGPNAREYWDGRRPGGAPGGGGDEPPDPSGSDGWGNRY